MSTAASPPASEPRPRPQTPRQPPGWAVVVMGVSGCGKSTVAEGIAAALGLACVDGDHLHTPQAVAKMKGGTPLTDEDRWPWLDRIGTRLCGSGSGDSGDRDVAGDAGAACPVAGGVVVSCSALRRVYRDRLRSAAPGVRFVFLDGSAKVIRARMQARQNHYMPPGLLDSQLKTLERPAQDERDVVRVDIDTSPMLVVELAVGALRQSRAQPGE